MVRTVVAIENERLAASICAALERGGVDVRFRCRTGAEAIRAIMKMGGGTVICQFLLPDMSANELYENLAGAAHLLVAAKPQYLDMCVSGDMLRLPLPASHAELMNQMERLIRLDERRSEESIPKRSAEDQRVIDRAKELLMINRGLTETSAHRYLQRRSMDSGQPMADTARAVINMIEQH